MSAVGSGVDQDILGRRRERTVEHDLQRLVARIAGVEREVVAENDEALGAPFDQFDDVGQVGQVAFLDLDDAQAIGRIFVEQGLDQ